MELALPPLDINPVALLGSVLHGLNAEQTGAYIRLALVSWSQVPPCTIPDDLCWLARHAGCSTSESWSGIASVVLSGWTIPSEGRMSLPWLRETYDRAVAVLRTDEKRESRHRQRARSCAQPARSCAQDSDGSPTPPPEKRGNTGSEPLPLAHGVLSIPAREAKTRRRDEIWDVVAELWHEGTVPKGQVTRVGGTVRDLRGLGATPATIRARYDAARIAWKGQPFGPEAIVKHWTMLGGGAGDEPGYAPVPTTEEDARELLGGNR